jgi:hypothetical protein
MIRAEIRARASRVATDCPQLEAGGFHGSAAGHGASTQNQTQIATRYKTLPTKISAGTRISGLDIASIQVERNAFWARRTSSRRSE